MGSYDMDTIINFVFILVVPVALIVLSLVGLWQIIKVGGRNSKQRIDLTALVDEAPYTNSGESNEISERITYLGSVASENIDPLLAGALKDIALQSKTQHNNYWLFNPANYLNPDGLLNPYESKVLNGLYSKIILIIGFLAAAGSAVSLFFVPRTSLSTVISLLLVPLGSAIALAYLLYTVSRFAREKSEREIAQMNKTLTLHYPVFTEQTGLARLSARMFEYEQNIKDNLTEFERTARKLVEGEFAEGINLSVRSIMSQEISPPIIKAADTLSFLADDLTRRQETGMADLAAQLATAIVSSLEDHLEPLNQHLGKLNEMVGETEAYMGVSVQTLETSREQNVVLNQEISEALRLMTLAKNDLANEMLEIRDYLEAIGDSTNKLARLYQGEDRSLSLHISNLANQLTVLSDRLNLSITESATALEQAADMTDRQEEYNTQLLRQLDEQIKNLADINQTITNNTTHFTKESSQLVHKTLSEYDAGLGEVIERLSFVVAEIRDAIDGLPVALRLSSDASQE
ncbi:MAG TPA: hypothetical protein GXZ59_02330 [Clostridiaceae bacterium]|nr:hypothetical protein [Clostridiaceae bacterium]